MITSRDFDRVVYTKPRLIDKRDTLSNIKGIDSEAYTSGVPFMYCTSLGDVFKPKDFPHCLFSDTYVQSNFMVYNLKYDSGAFLYFLPQENLKTLWETGKCLFVQPNQTIYRIQYIPHKLLRIYQGKSFVSFWDISQFFKMSLDKASQKYLNRSKIDIRTKRFTKAYVKRFWKSIAKYCIMDAKLTHDLGQYLVDKLSQFGITAPTLYSCASISFRYFCDNSKVVTVWQFWKDDQRLLKLACDAYQGGKFEVTTRGRFKGIEYDITSAYPYEIANLVDISNAKILYTTEYQEKAVYGFLDITIENDNFKHLPCGIMRRNQRIYPAGRYRLCVTKNEYDYLNELNIKTTVHDAVWLFVKRRRYPYRKTIKELFKIKDHYKGKDVMLYNVSKVVMNSFYGKTCQCIEDHTGKVRIGSGWNPIYAAVITANTRIAVTRIQNLMGKKCLAVHTDSVIVTEPLPRSIPLKGLGKFDYVMEGHGYLIACGMYQIGDESAFRGFIPEKQKDNTYDTWERILSRYPKRKKIPYPYLHVESWVEAMAKNHSKDHINVFKNERKIIDLNCDTKRRWLSKVTASDLLSGPDESLPEIIIENS